MRRLLAVLLVLVFVLFAFAACLDGSGVALSYQQDNADATTPSQQNDSDISEYTQESSAQNVPGQELLDDDDDYDINYNYYAANDDVNAVEFTRGYWHDGVYTNAFANLTFRLPDGWEYASHEQLDNMTAMIQASGPDNQMFFDMIAREAFATISLVIMFEPLPPDDPRASYSAEDYLDGAMWAYLQRPGISYISEMFEITFGGEHYYAFYVELDPATTLTYFARRVGGYMLSISILRLELYDVLSYFS